MITFTNPGEIDIHAITTLGISAKETSNPIGFFGTGLKYSIAVLLRERHKLTIFSGLTMISFFTETVSVRGQPFQKIMAKVNDQTIPLGFTTDLGKNWGLTEVYRELYSNTMDEQGEILTEALLPQAGKTIILVDGPSFEEVHKNRYSFLLNPEKELLTKTDFLEVYRGSSPAIFYKGIKVYAPSKPSALTYNFISHVDLTEDRTAKYPFLLDNLIKRFFTLDNADETLAELALTSDQYERDLDFTYEPLSEKFLSFLGRLAKDRPLALSKNLLQKYFDHTSSLADDYDDFTPSPDEAKMLFLVEKMASAAGFSFSWKIRTVESCGNGILGATLMKERQILLSRRAFSSTRVLLETLLHEQCHALSGYGDETKGFELALTVQLARVVQQLYTGTPTTVAPVLEDCPF